MGLTFEEKRFLLGLNITYYRRAKKITQAELAEKVNITSNYLSQIERGLKTVSLPILMDIAAHLGISEMALFDFRKPKQ
ncbi:helix-turn-helix transcriptional regulator [Selenomonas sp.]|uniref:helix-turn-helix domain-containing protein n=1 Tax=Selenomonas sp. TaxID=2053611 RepID=UPI002A822CC5|nr:helix-turn-helix transcriptional regulator [Selenomonas sp.]MDY4416692.1 helix-turn-helix transcriptional regulator [Selenomonas sp.]